MRPLPAPGPGEAPEPPAPPDPPAASDPALPVPTAPETAAPGPAGDDSPATSVDERARLEAELALELGAASPPPDAPVVPLPAGPKILPDISLVGTFAAAAFTREPSLRLAAHEPLHDGPQLQEIELALQSNVDPFLRADVYFAITEEGLEVEEAYATTLALPWNLQARAGHFYAPFGRFNQVHFLETTPFVDMPLPNRRFFGGEQLRGTGAEASVLLPLPFFLELRAAAITAGNEVSFGVEGSEIERATDLLGVARAMASFDLAARLTLNVGASIASGPNATSDPIDEGAHRTDVYGGDLYLRLRDRSSRAFTALQSEFMYRRASAPGGRVEQSGVYAWLVRRFDAHWEAAVRGDLLPGGGEAGRPELGEELGPFLEPVSHWRVGGAITWYPTEFQRLRLQVNHDSGIRARGGHARGGQEYFLQYQFVIGAHGAHPF